LGKYEEALSLFNPILSEELVFEKAYCLYRLQRLDESLSLIECALVQCPTGLAPLLKDLKAQVLYKKEAFTASSQVYQELLEKSSDQAYLEERQVNYAAVQASLGLSGQSYPSEVPQ
jgi:signal recognition particle subunit SRP72